MGINGDIGQDLSLCLPQIIMPQIIMKHEGQLYNMFDIYQLMNSKMRRELSQGEACLIFLRKVTFKMMANSGMGTFFMFCYRH